MPGASSRANVGGDRSVAGVNPLAMLSAASSRFLESTLGGANGR